MADLSYESFKQGKLKKVKSSNDLSYSTFLANKKKQEEVDVEKVSRTEQGLPVSVKDDRAKPTGVGGFIRSAIMPVADLASNVLGGTDLSNKYLGKVKGLGKIDITKSPLQKENLQTVKRAALTGLELGSYATGGSAVVGAGKNVVKQTVKEFIKTSGKQLAKEGAITSGIGSIGYQGREGKINPLIVARDIGIGVVAAPLLGAGINKLIGKKITKEIPKVTNPVINKVDEVATNSLSKSKVGIKNNTVNFLKENPQEITKIEVKLREVDGKIVVEDGRHTLEAAKETGITPIFKDVTSEYAGKKSSMIDSIITQKQPKVQISEQIVTKDIETFTKDIPEGLDYGTFKEWSTQVRNLDENEIINVAMGGEKTIQNTIPKNAYLSIAKNIAEETGDIKLAQRLAMSNVSSKSGQELVSSKLATSNNIVDSLRDIKITMMKKKGITPDKFVAEEKVLIKSIQKKFKEVTDDIIQSLICK